MYGQIPSSLWRERGFHFGFLPSGAFSSKMRGNSWEEWPLIIIIIIHITKLLKLIFMKNTKTWMFFIKKSFYKNVFLCFLDCNIKHLTNAPQYLFTFCYVATRFNVFIMHCFNVWCYMGNINFPSLSNLYEGQKVHIFSRDKNCKLGYSQFSFSNLWTS